jgi:cytidylate kinase
MLTTSSNLDREIVRKRGNSLTIAIDGPAGAGKSTVAQRVASEFGYLYIDTGAMYRAATWVALLNKVDLKDTLKIVQLVETADIELRPPDESSQGRVRVFVDGDDVSFIVRSRIISKFVSQVAAIAGVRHLLVKKQQSMGAQGGVVMDGRDIGTVVLPHADVKVFLTASATVRAERRVKELKQLGQMADVATLLKEIEARDHLDMTRDVSPLKQAPDAVPINTDHLSIDQVVAQVMGLAAKLQSAGQAQDADSSQRQVGDS